MARDFAHRSSQYLASIDAEIERLQHLREQVNAAVDMDQAIAKPAKATRKGMSAEGRRKIAEAQKARWAKQKKAATVAAKPTVKKAVVRKSVKPAAKKTAAKTAAPAQE